MGKTLIVAEKPSQARQYAAAFGVKGRGEGYFQNEHFIITWCIGHLLELERPEAYLDLAKVGKRWGLHRLPVLPPLQGFKHTVKASTRSQYSILTQLLKAPEIDKVICGTDADREGQLLFQEIWDRVRCQKPLERLWISSLTAEAIREGMTHLRTVADVNGLAQAGYGRSFADWDFGMNLTEGFTALFGSFDVVRKKPNVISIGRVQTPTLALVVEREWEIEQFKPVHYCDVEAEFEANGGSYTGKWVADLNREANRNPNPGPDTDADTRLSRAEADAIAAKVTGKPGTVTSLEAKEVQEPHPLLFDLTSLTVAASQRFGMSADHVLKTAQALYEKKAITYPRTDCNFLPPDILPKLPAHLRALPSEAYHAWVEEALGRDLPKGKRVINQITAHHAIIPTTERIRPEKLTRDEHRLWDLIVRRFLSIWFPPARYATTVVLTCVEGETFRTRGKVPIDLGWKRLETGLSASEEPAQRAKRRSRQGKSTDTDAEDGSESISLPLLHCQETVLSRRATVQEKETKPPKRYTQGDLLKIMENAGKKIEDELLQQQLKGKGLGTVATRPAIIENLLDRGYLLQDRRVLLPTEKGKELIHLIREELPKAQLLVSAEMTGQMEFELAQVEQGKMELGIYLTHVEQAILEILAELRTFANEKGKRPLAQAPMKAARGSSSTKKPAASAKPRGPSPVQGPTTGSPTSELAGDSRQGRRQMQEAFPGETEPKVLGRCPLCGGDIVEGTKGYGCWNWRQGCRFVVWKKPICGKRLSPTQMKKLLRSGSTDLIKGFRSKNGKSFAAYLTWAEEGSAALKFVFPQKSEKN